MGTHQLQPSATIYQFPTHRLLGERRRISANGAMVLALRSEMPDHGAWYHEAAIREAADRSAS